MYPDYAYYCSMYSDRAVPENDFNRLRHRSWKKLENATTGVDGFQKLKKAFPVDADSAEAVKLCMCELVNIMYEIEQAEKEARETSGYIRQEDGSMKGKLISSVSSGTESISYSSGSVSVFGKAAYDRTLRESMFSEKIQEYLSGIPDANGINLLYSGPYPGRGRLR